MADETLRISIKIDGANKSLKDIDKLRKGNKGLLEILENVSGAFQTVQLAIAALGKAYDLVIGQNERFNLTLLRSQAFLAQATDVFDQFGNRIVGVGQQIDATRGILREQLEALREDTRDLVGVTSSQVEEAFGLVTRNIGDIISQTENQGQTAIESARKLTKGLVAGLGTLGLPQEQFSQEIRSLLSGDFNTPDSVLGRTLAISKAEFEKARAGGRLVDFLQEKLEVFVEANARAAKTITGTTSNILDSFQIAFRDFGKPITEAIQNVLVQVDVILKSLQKTFQPIANVVGQNLADAFKKAGDSLVSLIQSPGFQKFTQETFERLVFGIQLVIEAFNGLFAFLEAGFADGGEPLLLLASFLGGPWVTALTAATLLTEGLNDSIGETITVVDESGETFEKTITVADRLGNAIGILSEAFERLINAIFTPQFVDVELGFQNLLGSVLGFIPGLGQAAKSILGLTGEFKKLNKASSKVETSQDIVRKNLQLFVLENAKVVRGVRKQIDALKDFKVAQDGSISKEDRDRIFAIQKARENLTARIKEQEQEVRKLGTTQERTTNINQLRNQRKQLEDYIKSVTRGNKELEKLFGQNINVREIRAPVQGFAEGAAEINTFINATEKVADGLGNTVAIEQRANTVIATAQQLTQVGAITTEKAVEALEKVASSGRVSTETRIKAQQALTKVILENSKSRINAISVESNEIQKAVAAGFITSAEAAVKNLDVQQKTLQENLRAQNAIRKSAQNQARDAEKQVDERIQGLKEERQAAKDQLTRLANFVGATRKLEKERLASIELQEDQIEKADKDIIELEKNRGEEILKLQKAADKKGRNATQEALKFRNQIEANRFRRIDLEADAELDKNNRIVKSAIETANNLSALDNIRLERRIQDEEVTTEKEAAIRTQNEINLNDKIIAANAKRLNALAKLRDTAQSDDQRRKFQDEINAKTLEQNQAVAKGIQLRERLEEQLQAEQVALIQRDLFLNNELKLGRERLELSVQELRNTITVEEATRRRFKVQLDGLRAQLKAEQDILKTIPEGERNRAQREQQEAKILGIQQALTDATTKEVEFNKIIVKQKEAKLELSQSNLEASQSELEIIQKQLAGEIKLADAEAQRNRQAQKTAQAELKSVEEDIRIAEEESRKGLDTDIKLRELKAKRNKLLATQAQADFKVENEATFKNITNLKQEIAFNELLSRRQQESIKTQVQASRFIEQSQQRRIKFLNTNAELLKAQSNLVTNRLKREREELENTFSLRKRLNEEIGREERRAIKRILAARGESLKTTEDEIIARRRLAEDIADREFKAVQQQNELKRQQLKIELELQKIALQRAALEAQTLQTQSQIAQQRTQLLIEETKADTTLTDDQRTERISQLEGIRRLQGVQEGQGRQQEQIALTNLSDFSELAEKQLRTFDLVSKDALEAAEFQRQQAKDAARIEEGRAKDELRGDRGNVINSNNRTTNILTQIPSSQTQRILSAITVRGVR